MIRTGMHFLFGQKESNVDFKNLIRFYSELGYNCLEIPPEPFLDSEGRRNLRELIQLASDNEMELVFSCGFPADCDMASEDEKIQNNGKDHLKKILEVMDEENINLLGGTFYTRWPSTCTGPLLADEKRRISERAALNLKEVASGIMGSTMELAIEPLNRFEGFLINTAAEGVEFCKLVDNPNVGLMLDGFHMSVEENSICGAVRIAGKYLKHLHLAENNRKLPGTGEFPWKDFFATLKEIGYSGRYDIESFVVSGGSVSASVALWRDLENGDALEEFKPQLSEALAFIKENI